MMTPLSENPAVVEPRKVLTPAQKDALGAINFFRQQSRREGRIQIGNKRFSAETIAALEKMELLRGRVGNLTLTTGGELALYRLQGGGA